jgi:hypothetical protein
MWNMFETILEQNDFHDCHMFARFSQHIGNGLTHTKQKQGSI